jgi:hypothetical protein
MSYKPYYGATNDQDQWWDGTTWKNFGHFDPKKGRSLSVTDILTQFETLRDHDSFNCHVDGVFKCPRCRRMHFIPDQFDLLCDGCASICETHPNSSQVIKDGLALWAEKRKAWSTDPDLLARRKERDRLWALQTTPAEPKLIAMDIETLPEGWKP